MLIVSNCLALLPVVVAQDSDSENHGSENQTAPKAADVPANLTLFDFEGNFELATVETRDVQASIVGDRKNQKLRLDTGHQIDWPGITLRPKSKSWDGRKYQQLSLDVSNLGADAFELGLRIDNQDGDAGNNFTVMTRIEPGESRTLTGKYYDTPYRFSTPLKIEGMHAAPGQTTIDPTQIVAVLLFMRTPQQDYSFTIDNVRFESPMEEVDVDSYLPFIDQFGQLVHRQWPGKTNSLEDLQKNKLLEENDLASHPGPTSFGRFGGWQDGPQFAPSKFFRTKQIDGKWWLVTPEGRLFWSHGIDSVDSKFGETGILDRESYFSFLPESDDPLAQFYGSSTWAYGFYASRIPFKTYNYAQANLWRKYGENWKADFAKLAHRRIRSWGLNSFGSWADPAICQQRKTSYAAYVHVAKGPVLEGATRMWTQFHDVFDPGFRMAITEGIGKCQHAFGDPWCIGFFVDNELFWGSPTDLAVWTLACPETQAAKKVFVDQLKKKYGSIEKLNDAWQSEYQDWEGLLKSTESPNIQHADKDLRDFSRRTAERYFRIVKEELNQSAPGQLYLGCRFIWDNPIAVHAASDFCDVVSFNRYLYSIDHLSLPEGKDKPILIGEFHFGATDRGAFHPSKVPAKNQQHRADCYVDFVRSALRNPKIVGTHWFAYASEPTSGRGDGENYHIGFVDVCDTPYVELVAASRKIGKDMYRYRSNFVIENHREDSERNVPPDEKREGGND